MTASPPPERSRSFGAGFDALQTLVRRAIVPLDEVITAVPSGGALLDLGCGQGLLLERLIERVGPSGRIVGVDLDSRKLEMARAALHALADRVELVQADLVAFLTAARPQSYRTILLVDTLSSLPPPVQREVLGLCLRALEVGGKLIIKMIAADPAHKAMASRALSTLIYRFAKASVSAGQRFWYLTTVEVAALLRSAIVPADVVVRALHQEHHHPIPHVLITAVRRAVP